LLEEAKAGKREVFFVDSAHFVMAAFLGILWSAARLFVKSPSGRQRFNVLGALHAITHDIITVCNDTYINSGSVCELMRKIRQAFPTIPISLVMDNARYQRCKLVMETAAILRIQLVFLPAYSPNLNLIERLWKFVKKQCLYAHYYENFAAFKTAIHTCVTTANVTHKKELNSLLTLNFQNFTKAQIIAV
jgi:transposase